MIELFSVKKYNDYDFVQNTVPSGTGTWLVSETFVVGPTTYTKGYSYNVVSGTPTRIEASEDARILANLHSTIKLVLDSINNYFYELRQDQESTIIFDDWDIPLSLLRQACVNVSDVNNYEFKADGEINDLADSDRFIVGDLIRIAGSTRNDKVGYVESLSPLVISNKDLRVITENAILFLSNIPKQLEEAISQMIHYDNFVRENDGVKRERIGNYSYEIDTDSFFKLGGLQYPAYWSSILNQYKLVGFVQ